ncbi:tRNA dihydrouridine synthase DusB [Melioribacteraceae bacterium 4301-Me]|uniref:tRNA dihydrouridine synthase DusB n=1 Tax=Pyranulibacter aquaticus TaxID=3163344 RepID=UPI003594D2C4
MRIGNLDLGNKLILAPMAEVTDSSFRKIAKEFGAGLTFTQMVNAEGVVRNHFGTLKLLSFNRSEKPIGVQILGNEPEIIGESVKEISKFNPDIIDLNCGCPVEKVVNKKMGSALLDDLNLLGKLIRKMKDNSNGIPISIKVRLGKDRNHINIIDTVRTAQDNGADVVFVHARARTDKYNQEPNWEWVKRLKEQFEINIVGNGSVFTPQQAKDLIESTGADSIMIARGALGNPFIFSRYDHLVQYGEDPGAADILTVKNTILRHLDYLVNDLGEFWSLDKAKKNVIWYFHYFNGVKFILDRIFALNSISEIKELVNEHSYNLLNYKYEYDDLSINHKKFKRKVLFWLNEIKEEVTSEVN